MARKEKKSSIISYSFETVQRQISESINIARWKPKFAIEWMEEITYKLSTSISVNEWNKAAKRINNTIDMIERQAYYNPKIYWGEHVKSKRLEFIDELISYDEYQKIMEQKISDLS